MKIQNLDSKSFFETISNSTKPIIVDFYADWCGPCKMIAPVMEELAGEEKDVVFYKVNVDENPDIAAKYSVMNIPAFIAFKGGQHYKSIVGAHPKQAILDLVK